MMICRKCNGIGKLKQQIRWTDKFKLIDCKKCNGTGKVPVPSTPAKEVKGVNKFRKKPVVIEALQFTSTNWYEIGAFAGKKAGIAHKTGEPDVCLIKTLEGEMRASKGDWIIKGVKGEFYPCKPDIFQQTYEAVNSTPANVPLPDELLKEIKELPEFIEYRDAIRTQHNHPFSIEYMRTFEAEDKLISAILLKCHQSEAAEIKELRERVESWEDLESSVCPEDYSISEYINSLLIKINDFTKKVETAEAINRGLEIKEIAVNSANKDYKARIKELEELNYKQSQMKCNRCPYNNPQEAAIRADQNKKIGEWGNEPCPHRNNDFPFPKAVPSELQMPKRECRDCWQEKFGIAKLQKGEVSNARNKTDPS
jgi:hypothetical protein